MAVSKEVLTEVSELVAKGKTERAIVLLRDSLKEANPNNRTAIRQILLLSGQFNNWEDEKLSGIREDSRELNRINRELLVLVENLENPQRQATAFIPVNSPDPLSPAYLNSPPQHPQPQSGPSSKIIKYVTFFFVGLGVLALISLLMEGNNEEPAIHQADLVEFQEEDSFGPDEQTFEPSAPEENPEEEQPSPLTPANHSVTSSVRTYISQMAASNQELDPSSLKAIDPNVLRKQLGNTNWYANDLNYVNFDASGVYGTYLYGNGTIEVTHWVDKGFYFGQYLETSSGDYGLIAIIPPGAEKFMTIYIESMVSGFERFLELGKR